MRESWGLQLTSHAQNPLFQKNAAAGEKIELLGNVGSFVDRLDEEFRKSLQIIDPHTTEYIDRLKDENVLYGLIVRSQAYYSGKSDDALAYAMIMMRRVEHIYFKVGEEWITCGIISPTYTLTPNLAR